MIGILIISHGDLGNSLIHCANHVMGKRPEHLMHLGVTIQDDPDVIIPKALELLKQLDCGDGVLILSDICGATPCNIANQLVIPGRVECLSGANLSMLVRAITYRNKEVEIINKLGLHARASAKITQLAGKFQSEVWLSRNEHRVNAKSIMGVMMLAANKGSKINIETTGSDETEAMLALINLIEDYFGEDE
jgi:PTS system mannose-specific IIA component